jgi:hypothetical protein
MDSNDGLILCFDESDGKKVFRSGLNCGLPLVDPSHLMRKSRASQTVVVRITNRERIEVIAKATIVAPSAQSRLAGMTNTDARLSWPRMNSRRLL